MLYLEENKIALDVHYNEVTTFIRKKIGAIDNNTKRFVSDNLETLIKGKPSQLIILNEQFYDATPQYSSVEFNRYIRKEINVNNGYTALMVSQIENWCSQLRAEIEVYVDYKGWSNLSTGKGAYLLAENLNRDTCTYCNRIYTKTIVRDGSQKVMRPQFDHWFSKSHYPLLALSFYNLIPSCSYCNSSVKGNIVLDLESYLHPYIDKDEFIKQRITFKPAQVGVYEATVDIASTNLKASRTFKAFSLKDIYEAHHNEINDLLKLKEEYSESYIQDLIKLYPKANLTEREIYRIVFGVEFDEQDFHKRPFSKLKKDILEELKIIKKS